MAAYLFTWNPARWTWRDLPEAIYRINNDEPYDISWSCGNTKRIAKGDLFFLMRLGVPPKGIVGCGYIESESQAIDHWDVSKAAEGKTMMATGLLFQSLSDEPIISLSDLKTNYPDYKWTPERGGVSIPDTIASEVWESILSDESDDLQQSPHSELRLYTEGTRKSITTLTYDRSSVARQECLEVYGYDCSVCGFRFADLYGDWGQNYIEVHHLNQIADVGREYKIDPKTDLRPVCANCHRMLHRTRPPLSIEGLKQLIRDKKTEGCLKTSDIP